MYSVGSRTLGPALAVGFFEPSIVSFQPLNTCISGLKMIHEAVVITTNADSSPHIAPLGFRYEEGFVVLAPFRPSITLENLEQRRQAVINLTDNVAVIAGCLTGRKDWPTLPAHTVGGARLQDTLAHMELEVERIEEDEVRPKFYCTVSHEVTHAPFKGFNRAQAAVLEAAILVSRLSMLPAEKIDGEIEYLKIAVDKTAGERELLAWGWLMEKIQEHRHDQEREGSI